MKYKFLRKGEIIDYQTMIEEKVGMFLSTLKIYDANWDRKSEINGEPIERDRAYFVGDADYEMVIKRISKQRK